MLYPKSLTCAGLFPLGGSGGPFLPQPKIIIAAANQIITVRAMAVAGFIFAGGLLIKLPAPNPDRPGKMPKMPEMHSRLFLVLGVVLVLVIEN